MQISTINYTAWLVITCQLALREKERWRDIVPEDNAAFYRKCIDYCSNHSMIYRALAAAPSALHLVLVESLLAKGATVHYALRKRAIAEQAITCLENGTRQIVFIGGGFDALGLIVARANPDVYCFEIDTPDMAVHKKQCIKNFIQQLPDNFYSLGTDLAKESMSATLRAHSAYDAAKPTLFIAEGLSMYLPTQAIERLLVDMRASAASSSMMFSAIEDREGRGVAKYLRDAALAVNNERFDWSMNKAEMPAFLKRHGFEERYQIGYAELQRPWREDSEYEALTKQHGEYLIYAQG